LAIKNTKTVSEITQDAEGTECILTLASLIKERNVTAVCIPQF